MKIVWKIIKRVLGTLGLMVYIIVALVNYSVVQSYMGAVVGTYFSQEWGGVIRIGSLHAMPIDHLILDDILWVSPTNDTILRSETIHVSFDKFPFRDNGLDLKHVLLRNTYYHMSTENHEINLKYVIDYFKSDKPSSKGPHKPFTVKAKTLELDNVHYKMDLPDKRNTIYPYGVQIPHMEFFGIRAKFKDVKVVNEDVTCRILRFRTREKSGFEMKNMTAQVHVGQYDITAKDMDITTGNSRIVLDAKLMYNTFKGISGYMSTVEHEVELKAGTRVNMCDVAYWAPRPRERRAAPLTR